MEPNSCFILVPEEEDKLFIWEGSSSNKFVRKCVRESAKKIRDVTPEIVKEGEESRDFWEILGGKHKSVFKPVQKDFETKFFMFHTATGQLAADRLYNYAIDDLTHETLALVDCKL